MPEEDAWPQYLEEQITRRVRAGRWIRRTFLAVIAWPGNCIDASIWFVQRGRRGWSDRDLWGLDDYLAGWLPVALDALKNRKPGIPMDMFDGLEMDDTSNYTDAATQIAAARWLEVLNKMIAGFEAWQRISDGLYEPALGPYPIYRQPAEGIADFETRVRHRMHEAEALRVADQGTFNEGMALFGKHFGSLWD